MPRPSLSPDRLFDRPWRAGHPFRPRCGRVRRLTMLVALIVLCSVIASYNYLTDSRRVRGLAEAYLSELVGGRVQVGGATLSVFEGLRLDDVRVYLDEEVVSGPGVPQPADSVIFSARTFIVQYSPRSMIRGELQATQIIAEKPQVHLVQDVRANAWNFHRLGRGRERRPAPEASAPSATPLPLPEILLRNARVELSELHDGRAVSMGHMTIDGQLLPLAGGERLGFMLQSRGGSDAMGPLVSGSVHLASGHVAAQLKQFEFGRDVRSMLPADVRDWWARHELAGRVDIPELDYTPAAGGHPARFTIRTELNDVNLAIPPEDWMTADEVRRRDDARAAFAMLGAAYRAAGAGPSGPLGPSAPTATPRPTDEVQGPLATGRAGEAKRRDRQEAGKPVADARGPSLVAGAPSPAGIVPPQLPAFDWARPPATPADALAAMVESAPIRLQSVSGAYVFTEGGIDVRSLVGQLEENWFSISGRIEGYHPDSRTSIRIASRQGHDLHLPSSPRYIWSLPGPVRELYEQLRPQGTCRLRLDVARNVVGGPLEANGHVDLIDGAFRFDEFPYPMRQTAGRVKFGRDPGTGWDWVVLEGIRGKGPADGPNRDATIAIDGWIGPVGGGSATPETGGDLRIVCPDIAAEPALAAALDEDVRRAVSILGGKTGAMPNFRGAAACRVARPIGPGGDWTVEADVTLTDFDGALASFPYPLKGLTGKLRVRDGYLDVEGVSMRRGDATVGVDGRVVWGTGEASRGSSPAHVRAALLAAGDLALAKVERVESAVGQTDLRVAVRGLPVDDDLLGALPPESSDALRRFGLAGTIDVDGRIFDPPDGAATRPTAATSNAPDPVGRLEHAFAITMRDGTIRPAGGDYAITGVGGKLRLTPDRLELLNVAGRRGKAELAARGEITFPGERPSLVLLASARNLSLEPALHAILPADAREAWDAIRPAGSLDVDLTYAGTPGGGGDGGNGGGAAAATTLPALASAKPAHLVVDLTRDVAPSAGNFDGRSVPPGLRATFRPREMSATLKAVPYRLDKLTGAVEVTAERIVLTDVTAARGDARLTVSGFGTCGPKPVWDLRLTGTGVQVDDEFRAALPAAMAGFVDSMKLKGKIGFDLPKIVYRTTETPSESPTAAAPAAAAVPAAEPEVDVAGTITLAGSSLDIGVPLEEIEGSIGVEAAVRAGHLAALSADVDVASLSFSGRPVRGFRTSVRRTAERGDLQLAKIRASVAGGDLAGQVDLLYPEDGPARYVLALALRNADVRELAKDAEKDINGRLTASLSMEGVWGQPSDRRGRGDVVVAGKEMYRIPLILGLLQVTNLALPISAPFNTGTARYSVDGQRVAFERIELRSNNMLMAGDGSLDFGTKQVRMSFVTDNPGGFKVPFLQDLWRGAQRELLRINVKGTVQDPKVQASTLGTFTTTIDEVLKGDAPGKGKGKRK